MSATIHKSRFQHLYCDTHNCHNTINWSIGREDGPDAVKTHFCDDCIKSILTSAPAGWAGDEAVYQSGYNAAREELLIELNNTKAMATALEQENVKLKELNDNLHDVIANFETPEDEAESDEWIEDEDDENEPYYDEVERITNENDPTPDPTADDATYMCLDCGYEVPAEKIAAGNGKRALTAHRMSCKAKS